MRIQKPADLADTQLDAIDRRILRVLQYDAAIANQALADEIGLSPPACARQILATAPGIRSYTSEVVLEVGKWTTEIPVEDA